MVRQYLIAFSIQEETDSICLRRYHQKSRNSTVLHQITQHMSHLLLLIITWQSVSAYRLRISITAYTFYHMQTEDFSIHDAKYIFVTS